MVTRCYKAYNLENAIYAEYVTAERISVKLALDSMLELYYKALKTHTPATLALL